MPPLVEDLRTALAEFPDIKLAVLFGSTARGQETACSDLDLGVLLDPYDVKRLWPIDLAANKVAKRTVDLIDLHTAPPLLRFEITRDGVVVVERDDYAWVDFKAKAMIDWWDWQPTARMIHRITAEKLREEIADGPT